MRLHVANAEYEGEGLRETQSVAFGDPALVFQYLSKSLYSRPHESMFREICANALDAHMAHNVARPFRVTLPSPLAPELVIRDWGAGMSHDFVMKRAMALADSTKRGDDGQVGGFGLGCKTPFAVTDQFSIKVYRGSFAQSYLIDRAGGLPRVQTDAALCETLDDAETGTEWRIPVALREHSNYGDIARRILRHFPVGSFEIANNAVTVTPQEYTWESDDCGVLKDRGAASYALVGPVAYRLDFGAVFGDADRETPKQGLELRFSVGAVTLHPSREQLEYDARTIAAIKAKVRDVRARFRADFEAQMTGAKTLWEAQCAFYDLHAKAGALGPFLPRKVSWTDASGVAHDITGLRVGAAPPVKYQERVEDANAPGGFRMVDKLRHAPQPKRFSASDLESRKHPKPYEGEWTADAPSGGYGYSERPRPLFMLDDKDGLRLAARAKMAYEARGVRNGPVLVCSAEILARLGVDYVKASDYTPPTAKTQRTQGRFSAYRNKPNTRGGRWSRVDVSLSQGGFFVPFKGASPENENDAARVLACEWWRRETVYGLSQTARAEIIAINADEELDPVEWSDVIEHTRQRAHDLLANADFVRALEWRAFRSATNAAMVDFVAALDAKHDAMNDPLFAALRRVIDRAKPQGTHAEADLAAIETLERNGFLSARASSKVADEWRAAMDELEKRRPLFALLVSSLVYERDKAKQSVILRALEVKA